MYQNTKKSDWLCRSAQPCTWFQISSDVFIEIICTKSTDWWRNRVSQIDGEIAATLPLLGKKTKILQKIYLYTIDCMFKMRDVHLKKLKSFTSTSYLLLLFLFIYKKWI